MDGASLARERPGVAEEEDALRVLLPQRITPNNNAPVRIVFGTEIFTYATTFEGVVFDGGEETLPQPIEPGDATSAIEMADTLDNLEITAASVRDVEVGVGYSVLTGDLIESAELA